VRSTRGGALLVTLVLLAHASTASASTLWVSLPVTEAAPCTNAQIRDAILLRRPNADLREGSTPGQGDLWADIKPGPEGWSLTVSGANERTLHRLLPPPGADCVDLSENTALMLDRFLEEIHWTDRSARIERIVHAPPPEPPGPPVPIRGVVELGPSLGYGQAALAPGLQLDVGIRRSVLEVALSGRTALPEKVDVTQPASVGQFSIQTAQLEVVAGARIHLGPGTLRLDGEGGTQLWWVSSSGPLLFHQQTANGVFPLLGARVGYEIGLPAHLALAVRAESWALLRTGTFQVEGYPQEITSRRWDGNLSVALSWEF
jgi:hypothetical protein